MKAFEKQSFKMSQAAKSQPGIFVNHFIFCRTARKLEEQKKLFSSLENELIEINGWLGTDLKNEQYQW